MEFRFRSVDDRSPPPLPIFNNLSDLPPPSPVNPYPSISHHSNAPPSFPLGGSIVDRRPIPSPMWGPNDVRDVVIREYEREKIKEEIILGEIARRREIELEVRWEFLCFEREMAARRFGSSFDNRFGAMPHVPWPHRPPMWWGSSPMPMSVTPHSFLGEHSPYPPRLAAADRLPLALPPRGVAGKLKLDASPKSNKEKLIVLAKPEPNVGPPPASAANEPYPFGLKKKPEDEWSCALCQVSAPNEKILSQHLRGKKHTAKEERLRSKVVKNQIHTYVPKKNKNDASDSKPRAKVEVDSLEENITWIVSNEDKNNGTNDFISKEKLVPEQDKLGGDLKNTAGIEGAKLPETKKKKEKDQFAFWCEMCLVGADCLVIMEGHKRGKKHRTKLQKHDQSVEAISSEAIDELPLKTKVEGDSLEEKITGTVSNEDKNNGTEDFKSEEELVPEKDKLDGDLKNTAGTEVAKLPETKKKKEKDQFAFWCEMCLVGADCSVIMEGHKRGKKHRTNLQKHDKNVEAILSEAIDEPFLKTKVEGDLLEEKITGTVSNEDKNNGTEDFESKEELVPEKDKLDGDLKKTAGTEVTKLPKTKKKEKDQFTFWCEMCLVGADCSVVMEDHKRGKKHRTKLQKHDKSIEAISSEAIDEPSLKTSCVSLDDIVLKPEVHM